MTSTAGSLTALLAAPPRPHPRLFLSADEVAPLRRRIAGDGVLRRVHELMTGLAEDDLAAPPAERVLVVGVMLEVSRTCFARIVRLALLWRLDRDPRHRDRARQEMLAAAAFTDWNHAGHLLDVAEMTAALAIGYDWLFDELDEAERAAIRSAIVRHGLSVFPGNRRSNNWNQVMNGGMVLGALAVAEHEPELAGRIVAQAVADVPQALHEYEPDGAYPEGPVYWGFGTSYHLLLVAALESAVGTDAGLVTPALLASAGFVAQMTGPTGLYFNFSDCIEVPNAIEPSLAWLAARGDDRGQAWTLAASIARCTPERTGRLLPFVLVWSRSPAPAAAPTALHYVADGRTPVAVHRSGWDADATWVAIKGGSPFTNHAHMDVGGFVVDGEGVRWACDLGMQRYHTLESLGIPIWGMGQQSQRWGVFRLGAASHAIPTFDGGQQNVDGHAPITHHSDQASIVDLTWIYAGQVAGAHRAIRLLPDRSVLVHDLIVTRPDRPATLRWAMPTRAEVEPLGDGSLLLRSGTRRRILRLLDPAGGGLRILVRAPRPQPYDAENPDVTIVGCELPLAAGTTTRIAVQLAPADAPPPTPELRAWPQGPWPGAESR